MSLTNIKRDGFHLEVKNTNESAWSSTFVTTADTALINAGDPSVKDEFASARADMTSGVSVAAASWKGIGCYISPPGVDMTPYRVKAYAMNLYGTADFRLVIGYAPASITGTDDTLSPINVLPFGYNFDDIIMVPALPAGDPLEGRALAFGLMLGETATSVIYAALSVQKLSVAPPAFAQAVS